MSYNLLLTWHRSTLIILKRKLLYNAMKKELMDILACPMCKGDLTLTVEQEDEKEVITGSLNCAKCAEAYPIRDTIPNLLPPDMRQ